MSRSKSKRCDEERTYNVHDTVLSVEDGVLYEARILRKSSIGRNFKYFVHYLKWARKYDCWIDESLIAHRDDEGKINQLNISLSKIKGNSTNAISTSTSTKSLSESSNLEIVGAREMPKRHLDRSSNQLNSAKSTTADSLTDLKYIRKRSIEAIAGDSTVDPAAFRKHRKHLLSMDLIDDDDLQYATKIDLPSLLKKQLVDEYSMLISQCPQRLLRLPKMDCTCVRSLLNDYLEEKRRQLSSDAVQLMLHEDLFHGLERYFDKALPSILLYRQERAQFDQLSSTFPDRSPSEMYGAEHMLRFYVRLPKLLNNVFLPDKELDSILSKLADFLKYLNKCLSKYVDPSNYVEVSEAMACIKGNDAPHQTGI